MQQRSAHQARRSGGRTAVVDSGSRSEEVNAFIRNNQDFDGVVDFDSLLRDPSDPTRLRADIDSGDHFHPNDLGAQQMADFFPLPLLR